MSISIIYSLIITETLRSVESTAKRVYETHDREEARKFRRLFNGRMIVYSNGLHRVML